MGDTKYRTVFEEIKGLERNISKIICGSSYTFIRLRNGKIISRGQNIYKQLAYGDTKTRIIQKNVSE